MKKVINLLTFIVVSCFTFAQELDSMVSFKLNYLDEFEPYSKTIYEETEFEKTSIVQHREGSHWTNYSKDYYKYDEEGRELEIKKFKWDGAWYIESENIRSYSDTLIVKSSFSYDNGIKKGVNRSVEWFKNGLIVEWQIHKGLNDGFTHDQMYFYRYENEDPIQRVHYKYDHAEQKYEYFYLYDDYFDSNHNYTRKREFAWSNNAWSQRVQEDFYYENGLLQKTIRQLKWPETDFIPDRKREYSNHDNEKRPLTRDTYEWNSTSELWILTGIDSLKYDQWGNVIEHASMAWDAQYDRISQGYKDIEEYDESGELIKFDRYKWNVYSKDWYLDYGSIKEDYGDSIVFNLYLDGFENGKSVYIYENGLRVRYRGYEKTGYNYVNNRLSIYYYSGLTNAPLLELNTVNLYPNPTRDKLYFSDMVKNVSVYNSNGAILLQKNECKSIDFSNLIPGIYIVEFDGNRKKVMKQ